MLIAQLESQRMYYEDRLDSIQVATFERIDRLTKEHSIEIHRLATELRVAKVDLEHLKARLDRERHNFDNEIEKLTKENTLLRLELGSERAVLWPCPMIFA